MFLKMQEIIIPGKPIAKKRPRFVRHRDGKGKHTFNPQETEEGRFLLLAMQQIEANKKITAGLPIILHCLFVFPRPKSHYGTGRNKNILKPSAPAAHVSTPDCSNLCKFPEDILNGYAWQDDSQIVTLVVKKRYALLGEEPYTKLIIFAADKEVYKELHSQQKN